MEPATPVHPFQTSTTPAPVPLVSPWELATRLRSANPPMVIDVRGPSERALGHLPDDHPFPLSELPRRYAELPTDRPIVAYDQYGAEGRRAAAYLRRKGFPETSALEGGLDEYARLIDPEIPRYVTGAHEPGLVLRQLPRRESGCLAYFLGDPSARSAILVDPGIDVRPYLEIVRHEGWNLEAIVETHTHADHLAGHAELHLRTGAPIYVSRSSPAAYAHRSLSDGEELRFGAEALTVLETPGHTGDHLTLRLRDKAFTGDTLLIGSCGRTDLGDGSPDALWESLTGKLLKLDEDTEIFPAHFGSHHALPERYVSSIGFERATNEALRQPDRGAFVKYMTEGWPPKPAEFDRIVAANLAP